MEQHPVFTKANLGRDILISQL